MRYAVIAAGSGSRLANEGVYLPKPLVKLNGEHLIERLIRIFMNNDASEILVICNKQMHEVCQYLAEIENNGLNGMEIPLQVVVKTTPSSMHSFYELSSRLQGKNPFILTTVDTVFREDEFAKYVAVFQSEVEKECDGLMAVTDYVDDEKPLYVRTDSELNITGFYDSQNGCSYISGGIYGLTPLVMDTLQACIDRGESHMRNFQRALIADGRALRTFVFSKILDIDHKSDVLKAEAFLREW
ncbi:MAG: NTP transferase domain-containing protein [Prevotella sp.]|nr:NTP transferase domain-containing protein [Prevotella sp.]